MEYITIKRYAPKGIHYAALLFTSVGVALNDKERSDPDRGYDYKDTNIVEYVVFKSREEMTNWVNQPTNQSNPDRFQLLEVRPLTVTVTASVID